MSAMHASASLPGYTATETELIRGQVENAADIARTLNERHGEPQWLTTGDQVANYVYTFSASHSFTLAELRKIASASALAECREALVLLAQWQRDVADQAAARAERMDDLLAEMERTHV